MTVYLSRFYAMKDTVYVRNEKLMILLFPLERMTLVGPCTLVAQDLHVTGKLYPSTGTR